MSEEPKKDADKKHSRERRDVIKAATSLALLPYVPPIIKTFLVDGGLGLAVPQGQRGLSRAAAVQQARARGLRGQALVQAVQNLVTP